MNQQGTYSHKYHRIDVRMAFNHFPSAKARTCLSLTPLHIYSMLPIKSSMIIVTFT
nr:MAG TPA: hypothetical protein [Caudoviricetes sp.]